MSIPTVASFSRSASILKEMAGYQDTIETLYEPGELTTLDASTQLRYTGIIRDLRAKIQIRSIAPQSIPQLTVEMDDAERYNLIQQAEWQSERFELWIYAKKIQTPDWLHLFSVSLANVNPFYVVNLLPYFTANSEYLVSPDLTLGASIKAAGFGFPNAATDSIVLFGSVKEELDVLPSSSGIPTQSTNHQFSVDNTPSVILPANPNRKGATIVNTTNDMVYLSLGSGSINSGEGIALMPQGGTYTIDYSNLYQGAIWAVGDADNGTTLLLAGNESV